MAALTQDRNTPMKGDHRTVRHDVAAGEVIFKGAIVSANAAGFLIAAIDAAGGVVVGVSNENSDNTGGANGDVTCLVLKGVAGLRADGVAPTQAEIGRAVMVDDDGNITTAASAAFDIPVGTLDSIDGSLFWVKLFDQA